jgi:hypothetical protein
MARGKKREVRKVWKRGEPIFSFYRFSSLGLVSFHAWTGYPENERPLSFLYSVWQLPNSILSF